MQYYLLRKDTCFSHHCVLRYKCRIQFRGTSVTNAAFVRYTNAAFSITRIYYNNQGCDLQILILALHGFVTITKSAIYKYGF